MTQADIQLLLQDLCARLPYGIRVNVIRSNVTEVVTYINPLYEEIWINDDGAYIDIEEIKPYLRPISSMTEDEEKEYHNICYEEEVECYEFGEWTTRIYFHNTIESIDWLNAHHFDYRGLIEKGLAIEITEENNPYED